MKATIYGYQNNEGRISHYNQHLVKDYNGGCALELLVDIPDELNPYASVMGDICIEVDGTPMELDLHADKYGNPIIRYADMASGKDSIRKIKTIEEIGWVSTARTL